MVTPPPPGAIRAHGAVVIILDNYILNMDHMFKNTANTGKKCILSAYDFKYTDISKVRNSNFLKPESGSEKAQIYFQIVNPLHEKCT